MRIIRLAATMFALATQGAHTMPPDRMGEAGAAWAFSFEAIAGGQLPLSAYRGKVLLVVNTASFCGFTPQYEGLQQLWTRYGPRGLVIVGVPSNDFHQERSGNEEIAGFCKGSYGISFPLAAKTSVVGKSAHPFYAWANALAGEKAAPQWNFHKYLIAADGRLVAAFPTTVNPLSGQLTAAIETELAKVATH